MTEAIIWRFKGIGQAEYDTVNGKLGLDPSSGDGDWPEGLLVHWAGLSDEGDFVLSEVWSSRDAQAAFMESRLGPALAASGLNVTPEVTWASLFAYRNLDS